ncbi:glycosyltransferase family 8 protein [Chaetomium fimeti]|uniref:Glycosyltransferase family 8 protein n=1 Tax=Chaetomium fimeti TaxID=1854472 RepID=A0AAE0LQ75_9PEZI|nr:glycosyltransferase family 8 protein [Chaetomium fimeti]
MPNGDMAAGDSTPLKVTNILSSRKLRLLIPATLFIGIYIVFGHRYTYDALSNIPSPAAWSKGQPDSTTPTDESAVDWSQFAYTQYVTDNEYLCNSVMLLERLQHVNSRADRVMMYPSYMLDQGAKPGSSPTSSNARLLIKARDEYGAKLVPIEVQSREGNDKTWAESFTKLLAFNQTQYKRVLSLDSDSVVLQNMDELFLLPSCPVAMPRAYWLYPETKILSSQLVLVEPSEHEFARVMAKVDAAGPDDYDMEILNYLYGDTALVLPHRPYDLLTQVFRWEGDEYAKYLGDENEAWDPVAVFNEAKFLHFSDWPVPKPWKENTNFRNQKQPACRVRKGTEYCVERDLWNGFYEDFMQRRKRIC